MTQSCSPLLIIQKLTKLPFLYIERGTGQYFHNDIDSDGNLYRVVPGLLSNQLITLIVRSLDQNMNEIPRIPTQ